MEEIEIIFGLLFVMIVLVALARRINIAYPILLVIAGLGISFIPGLPKTEINPEVVFIVFLPPILQMAGYSTPIRDFRANLRSIGMLAIGLVLATMAVVAVVAHNLIGLSWPESFLLGAIIAPPDAIAATSVAQRLNLPRRIVTVLEGESLLNDATSLVAYRVALAAVVSGTFSFLDAGWQFVFSSVGGVLVGLVVGVVGTPFFRRLTHDIPVYIILTFLSGYAAYLLAEQFLHVSGVLAVVVLGLFYVRHNTMTPELRLQATPVWESVVFLLNGLVFILIGLQLRGILERIDGSSVTIFLYAVAICVTVIVVRIAWMFPGAYLPRLPRKIRERDPFPPWQWILITGWTGMRGIVSLAAALALPITLKNGTTFANRDIIIFLTFSVILGTLVLQGLSLPLLIRWLKVKDDGKDEHEEHKARLKVAHAGRDRLFELAEHEWVTNEMVEKLRRQYETRIQRFTARYNHDDSGEEAELRVGNYGRLRQELIQAERTALLKLRDASVINDEILRRVQYELDLEWLQLQGR